jgi:hypothetical protein
MKSIKFKESNKRLTGVKDVQGNKYPDLFFKHMLPSGNMISCFKAPIRQRIAFLFHGKIWISIPNQKVHPPISVNCVPSVFFIKKSKAPKS